MPSVSPNETNEVADTSPPIAGAHDAPYNAPPRPLSTSEVDHQQVQLSRVGSNGNVDLEALQLEVMLTDHAVAMQTLLPTQSTSSEATRASHCVSPIETTQSTFPADHNLSGEIAAAEEAHNFDRG
jgi:hypothetical protein